ncbi:MAG: SH3 domain-containing protein, partial [Romboutsia sp.]|nr:SH3 domain-containing protein [Romboutsia sp.]
MNLKLKKMVMSIISLSVSMSLIQANASNTLTDDEVEKIESKFSINNYLGDTSNLSETEGYYYKEGRIPVLISAPHSIKQPPRPDSNKDYKSEDKYTGTIAEELAKRTGAHVIYRTGYTGVDDNFPVDSKGNEVYDENGELIKTPYREKIKDIVKNNEIKLVIDLHGFASNDSRDYGVEFGTNYNKNFVGNDDILNIILEEFEKEGFELRSDSSKVPTTKKIVIDKEFTAKVKNRSVSNYTATTLKTPAIQMEFCSENRKNIDDLNDTIDALERVVNGVSKYEYKTANVTAPNFVYFRDKANFQESSIIKKINRGEAVTIISKYNVSFYKVKYNGELGYVSSKYLEQRG